MRQYDVQIKETKDLQKIICNKCGKEIIISKGVPQEDYLEVEKRWVYQSNKDNQVDCFDLCEDCYDDFVKGFKIKL